MKFPIGRISDWIISTTNRLHDNYDIVCTNAAWEILVILWHLTSCYAYCNMHANELIKHLRCSILMCCTHTSGLPCLLTSICANEQTSPTPTTSTVKFLKKSTISRDLYRKLKHKRNGVIMGLTSSWITNSWKHMRRQKQIQGHSSVSVDTWSKTF